MKVPLLSLVTPSKSSISRGGDFNIGMNTLCIAFLNEMAGWHHQLDGRESE